MNICQQCGGDIALCTQPVNGSCGWVMVARTEWNSLVRWAQLNHPEKNDWDAQPPELRIVRTNAIRTTFAEHQRLITSMLHATPPGPAHR